MTAWKRQRATFTKASGRRSNKHRARTKYGSSPAMLSRKRCRKSVPNERRDDRKGCMTRGNGECSCWTDAETIVRKREKILNRRKSVQLAISMGRSDGLEETENTSSAIDGNCQRDGSTRASRQSVLSMSVLDVVRWTTFNHLF